MKTKFILLAIIAAALMCLFSCKNGKDRPAWLEGKWVGENISFIFRDTTLTMVYNGKTFHLGGFHVNKSGEVLSYGTPVGLSVNFSKKTLTDTESGQVLEHIINKDFPKEYEWILGTWSDPSLSLHLTKNDIELSKFGELRAVGSYVIKDNELVVDWDTDFNQDGKFKLDPAKKTIKYSYHTLKTNEK